MESGDTARLCRKYYSDTPLNRLVDAALPESDTGRKFERLAEQPLQNANEIKTLLTRWLENQAPLSSLLETEQLQEIKPLAKTVAELCEKGIEALHYIESNQTPPLEWIKESSDLINRAEKPQAELLPAILPGIRTLIKAAQEQQR